MSMLHNRRFAKGYVPGTQKTYLSREMTRAMALDHPIGDPHGGPAFGERNDPVTAVISIGTLFATGGAVLAGTATLMTGLAFAGAAISLVGNISGNKTLSKIGMITGLAGGVGMLAESAGMFASPTLGETFGYGAGANPAAGAAIPTSSGGVPADVSGAIVEAPSPVNPAPNVVPDAAPSPLVNNPANNLVTAELAPPGGVSTAAPAPSSVNLSSSPVASDGLISNAAGPNVAGAPAAPTATSVSAPTVPGTGYGAITNPAVPGDQAFGWQYFTDGAQGVAISPEGKYFMNGSQLTGAGGGAMGVGDYASQAWQGMKSIGSGFMDLAKSNPGAAYMLGQGVSSLGDVLSGKADAQINALEAQGELGKAQAEKLRFELAEYKRKQQLMNSNYANVRNPLATWQPNIQTTPPGIIGNAMQPAPRG